MYHHDIAAPCLREVAYRSGIVDRPGSFYAMQNDIEEELESSSDDAQTAESKHRISFNAVSKDCHILKIFIISLQPCTD